MGQGFHRLSVAGSNLAPVAGPRRLLALAGLGLVAGMVGCETDSYLDPSVMGRWEQTPTVVPILDRIAAIEEDTGDLVEYSEPTAQDLVPVAQSYRIGPGDGLTVIIYDLVVANQPEEYRLVVDARGFIEIPQLGRLQVSGKTEAEAKTVIEEAMRRLVANPLVSVTASSQQEQIFTLIGAVTRPGPYFIPKPDYRLLEALTTGGNFDESIADVYVIRRIALADELLPETTAPSAGEAPAQPRSGEELIDIIDDITAPQGGNSGGGNPGAFVQPENQDRPPAVDLPDGGAATPATPAAEPMGETNWVFLNGRWVEVAGRRASNGAGQQPSEAEQLVTQRIIRIPLRDLLAGKQTLNIVIRPGDIVRVPQPPSGLVYMAGQVARPGPYQLPAAGKLTLLRALDSAGGLSGIAIPERIDLTRMVGRDRQATIRLNGRAIAEATQPDVFLKPDDRINVGTNFWALPLAVVRNGFRASYGFGFLLDRNFGNDVFGAPPTNINGGG